MSAEAIETVTQLRTDAVKAQAIRDAAMPHLLAICEIMQSAKADGLVVNFNITADTYGRFRPAELTVIKPL